MYFFYLKTNKGQPPIEADLCHVFTIGYFYFKSSEV